MDFFLVNNFFKVFECVYWTQPLSSLSEPLINRGRMSGIVGISNCRRSARQHLRIVPCTGGLNPSHHFCAENLENLSRTQWAPLTDSGLTLLGLEREAPHVRLTSIDMTLHFSASMFQQGERTIFTSYFRLIVSCPDLHLQMLSSILQAQNSIGLLVRSPQLQTELDKL